MPRSSRARGIPLGASVLKPLPSIPGFIDTALVAPRATLADPAATRQMADDMRLAGQREGGLTRDGLELLGYTAAQIDRLGGKARQRAQALAGASL